MTTKAAEALYLAQHNVGMEGKEFAIYNPQGRPPTELPAIFGFNNGGSSGWYSAVLLAEDGTGMGSHCCSAEGYMKHDLGILEGTRPDRHESFKKHYPDGYRMEWVETEVAREHGHPGLELAIKRNSEMAPETADSTP